MVPPELRLIQSKKLIESPEIKFRSKLISHTGGFSAEKVKAVIFDMDGTLTQPGQIDFKRMREELQVPQGSRILEYIESITDPKLK